MNGLKAERAIASAPATTANLGPGFDCLGLALDLYNEVDISINPKQGLVVEVSGNCAPDQIPTDRKNLVYRATQKVFELAGVKAPNLQLRLNIAAPLSRGLGSSASAIVGGMAAANAMLTEPLSDDVLLREMAAMEGHPDNVVSCARGGLTAAIMVDDRIFVQKHRPAENVRCVILIPDYDLPTAKARQALPRKVPLRDAVFNLTRVPFVIERLVSGQLDDLALFMDDRLHQPYRKALIHSYDEIVTQAEEAGAAAVCVSGAGPAMLAICDKSKAKQVAEAMMRVLKEVGIQRQAIIAQPDERGAAVSISQSD